MSRRRSVPEAVLRPGWLAREIEATMKEVATWPESFKALRGINKQATDMKERDYIDATNLAKLRIALHAVCDVLPMNAHEEADKTAATKAIAEYIERLEKRLIP